MKGGGELSQASGTCFSRQISSLHVRSDGGAGTALTESVRLCLTVIFNAARLHYRNEHQRLAVFRRPSSLEDT